MLALTAPCFSADVVALIEDGALTGTQMRLERNTHLYNRGDDDNHVFLVENGQVKTFTVSDDGKDCVLCIYGPGEVLGELCVLQAGRTETASTMKPTTVFRMSAGELLRVLSRRGKLEGFLRHEAMRIADQQELITSFVTMNSEHRLAVRLLHLARQLGTPHPAGWRIEERITQEELASMVGTTRSRVGFFLKRFADAGLVQRTSESFLLVEEEALRAYLRGRPMNACGQRARPANPASHSTSRSWRKTLEISG